MSDKKIYKEYEKDDLLIGWEPGKCIHAKKCWKELGSVFKPMKRPWINPDQASKEEIIKQIDMCPSGALSYKLKNKETRMSEETNKTQFKVNMNGSLTVTGDVEIKLPDGTITEKSGRFSICRCGLSNNKPFCDGSHKETGFDKNWDIEIPVKED